MTLAKKIVIFNADTAKPYLEKHWGDFSDMAIEMLESSRGETPLVEYVTYQVCLNEFPVIDDLKSPDVIGIYITGSVQDSFSNSVKWIVKLREMMSIILQDENFPPVAGVCFGHQIVAASLGYKVDRNAAGLEIGVVPVHLTPEAIELGIFQDDRNVTRTIFLSEVHGDVVYEVPEGFTNLGFTEKCSVQGLYKKNRVLTVQGHPEFSTDVDLLIMHHNMEAGLVSFEKYTEIEERSRRSKNQGPLVAKGLWKLFNGII
ncbi:ZYBA0S16-00122g1_1 [Zygosaccharomyces bailii CLIB 213]|uniref:ZYBA0S16-00122g1_1 n=1 Tax=Zygosaccharomyces bailii (strain CLIB 213 / ATCC 58445 / CBS 680 / BCRC 21525 / NBRC 1098 / NCYC 1416 / NRRL Y-2227) TaxID=1333698 RepID=A0A8J2TBC3_ZYGB2|nr:ZYBA0S16-00122g1_1 [Zygosaccharomyces bailii CLIB 213]